MLVTIFFSGRYCGTEIGIIKNWNIINPESVFYSREIRDCKVIPR